MDAKVRVPRGKKAILGNIKDNKKSLTEDKMAAYYQ